MTHSFAILPAAGLSRRMGTPKLLLPWQGRLLIEHVVATWRESRVDEVVVVVSPDHGPLIEACTRLSCRLVVPDAPPPDMKASVGCGLRFVAQSFSPKSTDCWLVAPADLPALRAGIINSVLETFDPDVGQAVVPCHGTRRGHPVLFPWRLAQSVWELSETETLKDLLTRVPITEVAVADPSAFDDLDTPQDYQRLREPRVLARDANLD